jgi:hypothetical protein
MTTPEEQMTRGNVTAKVENACPTSDKKWGDTATPDRRLMSAGEAAAYLANRCPTCLVEMEWIHSHYQCPRCHWRDSCCM